MKPEKHETVCSLATKEDLAAVLEGKPLPPVSGSVTFTRYHMSLSVRGALNWPKAEMRRLAKSMTKPDGSALTPEQAREALMDELAKGHEVVPIGIVCDNWDWKEGCKGHRAESPNA